MVCYQSKEISYASANLQPHPDDNVYTASNTEIVLIDERFVVPRIAHM